MIKPQPPERATFAGEYSSSDGRLNGQFQWCSGNPRDIDAWQSLVDGTFRCPYGQPGDRLWVRETFAVQEDDDTGDIVYRADIGEKFKTYGGGFSDWRPSIHMPRWASRLTLEITEVRVQRLQEINHRDVLAEAPSLVGNDWYNKRRAYTIGEVWRASFQQLWDSINLKRGFGWDANPWVWAITFKPIGAEQ